MSGCQNIDGQCGASWCDCEQQRKETTMSDKIKLHELTEIKSSGLTNCHTQAMRWLERLTPCGSEFHNEPKNCFSYIIAEREKRWETVKRQQKRIIALERENAELIRRKQRSEDARKSLSDAIDKLEAENAELKAEILRAELLVLQGSSGFEKENAMLKERLQKCATMDEAQKIALVRAMQEIRDAVGIIGDCTLSQLVFRVQELVKGGEV